MGLAVTLAKGFLATIVGLESRPFASQLSQTKGGVLGRQPPAAASLFGRWCSSA